jgi:hypothetical protein
MDLDNVGADWIVDKREHLGQMAFLGSRKDLLRLGSLLNTHGMPPSMECTGSLPDVPLPFQYLTALGTTLILEDS